MRVKFVTLCSSMEIEDAWFYHGIRTDWCENLILLFDLFFVRIVLRFSVHASANILSFFRRHSIILDSNFPLILLRSSLFELRFLCPLPFIWDLYSKFLSWWISRVSAWNLDWNWKCILRFLSDSFNSEVCGDRNINSLMLLVNFSLNSWEIAFLRFANNLFDFSSTFVLRWLFFGFFFIDLHPIFFSSSFTDWSINSFDSRYQNSWFFFYSIAWADSTMFFVSWFAMFFADLCIMICDCDFILRISHFDFAIDRFEFLILSRNSSIFFHWSAWSVFDLLDRFLSQFLVWYAWSVSRSAWSIS